MRKKELLGALLLSVGVVGIWFSVRDSLPPDVYFTTVRDLAAGEVVSSTDFQTIPLDLRGTGAHYISAKSKFSHHRVIRRIAKGEILPRDAISKRKDAEQRKQVTFTLLATKIPAGLKDGDLVDIYFFNVPSGGVTDSSVQLLKSYQKVQIDAVAKAEGQINGESTLTLLIDPGIVGEFLTYLASSETFLVRGSQDGH